MKRSALTVAAASAAAILAFGTMAAYASPAAAAQGKMVMNWYGGPAYMGSPALKATAALVRAGGGAENFSFPTALVAMLGQKTVNAEVAKLDKQYGKKEVESFLSGVTFNVKDGLHRATEAGLKLPAAPVSLKGVKLAKALVGAGTSARQHFLRLLPV